MRRILFVASGGGKVAHVNRAFRRSFFPFKAGFETLTSSVKQISPSMILLTNELSASVTARMKKLSYLIGLATVAFATGGFLISNYSNKKAIVVDSGADIAILNYFPSKIKDSAATTVKYDMIKEKDLYVERPQLLKQITDIFDRKEANERYFIMYGAKGVGKSTIAERAAKSRKGVMMIRMTAASSRDDLMLELIEVLKVHELKPKTSDFISALNKAQLSDGTLPTIIVEIEIENRMDRSSGIKAIRGVAKDLSAACNFLIILSEANAVLEFGNDRDREDFIYVGELTEPEAREYISKLKMELSEKDIKHVMDNVGTNPATIRSMREWVCEGRSIQDFVVEKLADAKLNLVAFPHKAILKALNEHPEGVSPEYFNNMKNEGIDLSNPVAVGNEMKLSNAIMYRIKERKYMIISSCHQTALKTYKPTVAN